MNRINQLLQDRTKPVLSIYYPAGYPNLNDTTAVLHTLQQKGIDMVEIGIPFSDPMADGPVIQEASTQALRNGISLRLLFQQIKDIRKERITMPIILMGYLNPIMQYGFESFCQTCAEIGIDGVIIPDLPFADYLENYKPIADQYGQNMIMLITPETSDERIRQIDEHTDGFIYMVSSAATTGMQKDFESQKQHYFKRIKELKLKHPYLIGFGISNKATYEAASQNSSGGIIGSKFVQLLKTEPSIEAAVDKLLQIIHADC